MRKLQVCNLCSAVQDATHKQKKTFVEGGTILIVEGLFKRNPLLTKTHNRTFWLGIYWPQGNDCFQGIMSSFPKYYTANSHVIMAEVEGFTIIDLPAQVKDVKKKADKKMPDGRVCPDHFRGWLLKWTNYIKGYQRRWFVLCNGLLSYYR